MYENPDLLEPEFPTHNSHNTLSIPIAVRSRGERSFKSGNSVDSSEFPDLAEDSILSMKPRIIAAMAAAIGVANEVPLRCIIWPSSLGSG